MVDGRRRSVHELGNVVLCDLTGPVDDAMVRKAFRFDVRLRAAADDVHGLVRIASDGGDIDCGLVLFELLRAAPKPVTTFAIGAVFSSAIPPFAAGRKRILTPNSRVLIHALTTSGTALLPGQIAEMLANVQGRLRALAIDIADVTRQPIRRVTRDIESGKVFTAREAVRYGLATLIASAPGFDIVEAVE
jgi:ATP-dependent Clp protease protease subunit